jgi:hypothetical protein
LVVTVDVCLITVISYVCTLSHIQIKRGQNVALDDEASTCGRGRNFRTTPLPAPGLPQAHVQWVPGAVSSNVKGPERGDHSSPSRPRLRIHGAIPPLPHTLFCVEYVTALSAR